MTLLFLCCYGIPEMLTNTGIFCDERFSNRITRNAILDIYDDVFVKFAPNLLQKFNKFWNLGSDSLGGVWAGSYPWCG